MFHTADNEKLPPPILLLRLLYVTHNTRKRKEEEPVYINPTVSLEFSFYSPKIAAAAASPVSFLLLAELIGTARPRPYWPSKELTRPTI